MRAIRGLIDIIGIAVILIAGYWIWYANWGPNPNDKVGTTIAAYLPPPFKDWGCGKLAQRFGAGAPTICSALASPSTPPTEPGSAPATPSAPGGGRL